MPFSDWLCFSLSILFEIVNSIATSVFFLFELYEEDLDLIFEGLSSRLILKQLDHFLLIKCVIVDWAASLSTITC